MGGLGGKTVLVTRRREQSASLVEQIEQRGGKALVIPMIQIEAPESWAECDRALARLTAFSAMAFTSVNGVEAFFERCRVLGVDRRLLNPIRIYAVGERTGAAVEQNRLPVVRVPERFTAAELARAIPPEEVRNKRFLLPQGSLAMAGLADLLREKGAVVETVTVYRTVEAALGETKALLGALERFEIDGITFASPSAARGFAHILRGAPLPRRDDRPWVAVIGPTTAGAVLALGLPVDVVAREGTAAGLVRAVEEYLQQSNMQSR